VIVDSYLDGAIPRAAWGPSRRAAPVRFRPVHPAQRRQQLDGVCRRRPEPDVGHGSPAGNASTGSPHHAMGRHRWSQDTRCRCSSCKGPMTTSSTASRPTALQWPRCRALRTVCRVPSTTRWPPPSTAPPRHVRDVS